MTKKACMSNCKDPENRSKKSCVCGAHSTKAKNAKKKKKRRIPRDEAIPETIEKLYGSKDDREDGVAGLFRKKNKQETYPDNGMGKWEL